MQHCACGLHEHELILRVVMQKVEYQWRGVSLTQWLPSARGFSFIAQSRSESNDRPGTHPSARPGAEPRAAVLALGLIPCYFIGRRVNYLPSWPGEVLLRRRPNQPQLRPECSV